MGETLKKGGGYSLYTSRRSSLSIDDEKQSLREKLAAPLVIVTCCSVEMRRLFAFLIGLLSLLPTILEEFWMKSGS